MVLITTNNHAEFVGEEILYSWELTKVMHCNKLLDSKKRQDNFHAHAHKFS
jgi:hypothetical protein